MGNWTFYDARGCSRVETALSYLNDADNSTESAPEG
jgi:hypothetical protein